MSNFKLPDELLGGAVKVIRPTDLRNRVGMYMMEERGIKMGCNVDLIRIKIPSTHFFLDFHREHDLNHKTHTRLRHWQHQRYILCAVRVA